MLSVSITLFAGDKLGHLRTSKKIISVDVISPPYFTIQIVALQLPPENAAFFNNFDVVKEYACNDGYVRYTVGEYNSFEDAAKNLNDVWSMGYGDAFVLNLRKLNLSNSPDHGSSAYSSGSGYSTKPFVPVPGQKYTIQLAAFRYPVYLSFFEGFSDVKEYYMTKDRIYRYCIGVYEGNNALSELQKVKDKGYRDAYLVPVERYAQYLIE
jgi:hypothetical protein